MSWLHSRLVRFRIAAQEFHVTSFTRSNMIHCNPGGPFNRLQCDVEEVDTLGVVAAGIVMASWSNRRRFRSIDLDQQVKPAMQQLSQLMLTVLHPWFETMEVITFQGQACSVLVPYRLPPYLMVRINYNMRNYHKLSKTKLRSQLAANFRTATVFTLDTFSLLFREHWQCVVDCPYGGSLKPPCV
jgi:hypothetical protein